MPNLKIGETVRASCRATGVRARWTPVDRSPGYFPLVPEIAAVRYELPSAVQRSATRRLLGRPRCVGIDNRAGLQPGTDRGCGLVWLRVAIGVSRDTAPCDVADSGAATLADSRRKLRRTNQFRGSRMVWVRQCDAADSGSHQSDRLAAERSDALDADQGQFCVQLPFDEGEYVGNGDIATELAGQ